MRCKREKSKLTKTYSRGSIPIEALDAFWFGCPDYLKISPAVQEVWTSYRWFDKGIIEPRLKNGYPLIMSRAVSDLDSGYQHGQAERFDEERAKAGKR